MNEPAFSHARAGWNFAAVRVSVWLPDLAPRRREAAPLEHSQECTVMRISILVTATAALAAAMGAAPAAAADFTDLAPVLGARPVVERIAAPRQECWNETVTVDNPQPVASSGSGSTAAGTIIGGVVGGVVGHQIGSGRGNDVATVAGTIVGALAGNSIASKNAQGSAVVYGPPTQQVVQRCRTVDDWQDVIRGYDVTYRYGGRDATVRLPYDPGPQVRVSVSVVDDGPRSAYAPPPPRR